MSLPDCLTESRSYMAGGTPAARGRSQKPKGYSSNLWSLGQIAGGGRLTGPRASREARASDRKTLGPRAPQYPRKRNLERPDGSPNTPETKTAPSQVSLQSLGRMHGRVP